MTTFIGLSDFSEIGQSPYNSSASTKSIHLEIINRSGKKHPRVLYIPTAKDDRDDYIKFFEGYYKKLGCNVSHLLLVSSKPSKREITEKIRDADIIYVNGGNTYKMLRVWKRLGVDVLIKQAYARGVVIAGHSAGLVCWFEYGCSNSFYDNRPFRLTGMGIFKAVVCPHIDSQPFRLAALQRIMKRTPGLVGLALDDAVAIEIIDDTYRLLKASPAATAWRTYWNDREYYTEEISASRKFQPLEALLQKPVSKERN